MKTQSLVQNSVLALPSMRAFRSLPLHTRELLAELLGELALAARQRADTRWRRHKGAMAAYWKAVSVYAGHVCRALLTGEEVGEVAPRTKAGGDALTKRTSGEGSWERAGQAVGGPRSRLGALPDV